MLFKPTVHCSWSIQKLKGHILSVAGSLEQRRNKKSRYQTLPRPVHRNTISKPLLTLHSNCWEECELPFITLLTNTYFEGRWRIWKADALNSCQRSENQNYNLGLVQEVPSALFSSRSDGKHVARPPLLSSGLSVRRRGGRGDEPAGSSAGGQQHLHQATRRREQNTNRERERDLSHRPPLLVHMHSAVQDVFHFISLLKRQQLHHIWSERVGGRRRERSIHAKGAFDVERRKRTFYSSTLVVVVLHLRWVHVFALRVDPQPSHPLPSDTSGVLIHRISRNIFT